MIEHHFIQAHLAKSWSPSRTHNHNKNDCHGALIKRKERRKLMLVPFTDSMREFTALRADKEASKASKTFHRHSLHQKKNKRWTWKYRTVWFGGFFCGVWVLRVGTREITWQRKAWSETNEMSRVKWPTIHLILYANILLYYAPWWNSIPVTNGYHSNIYTATISLKPSTESLSKNSKT